jgi:hypothetical protein
MSLPMCKYARRPEAGYYRSAAMLVGALQVFLSYSLMLNPRIAMAATVGRLHGGCCCSRLLGSLVSFAVLWFVGRPIILLLWANCSCGRHSATVLVSAAPGVASGLLVWGCLRTTASGWR